MDRDALVAEMADAIFRLRSANRDVKSSDLARAALAVAEPVVRKWEREKAPTLKPHGCVCPAGAESSCRGWQCPRRAPSFRTGGTP